jgi:hypothetical protein
MPIKTMTFGEAVLEEGPDERAYSGSALDPSRFLLEVRAAEEDVPSS